MSWSVVALTFLVALAIGAALLRFVLSTVSIYGPPVEDMRMFGLVTIPQNEAWSVVSKTGELSTVEGPKTIVLTGEQLRQLSLVAASESEYIRVQFRDGHTDIIQGPAALLEDPAIHVNIERCNAVSLSGSELMVVYQKDPDAADSSMALRRKIIQGPRLYAPADASEYTHQFSWHGHDPSGDAHGLCRKRPHALKFTKLMNTPMQTYYDVENARTNDDALLTIRLMVFYHIADVPALLDATNDPIAEMINALSSDIIEFTASGSFETFKESAEQLSNINRYKNLLDRAGAIGLKISKVVFRGYIAPSRLQKMHDDAIERRTRLVLERETEEQEQRQRDERLAREEARAHVERKMRVAQAEHDAALELEAFEAEQGRANTSAANALAAARARDAAEAEHLARMRADLGLSPDQIASFLAARANGAPSKLVQIQAGPGGSSPQLRIASD
eukprot:CAMPEP_0206044580 /NCGR_PEP_ID=MMETSP1466-20131121/13177_1 /ASSEMBLY_ACC=CAM_ASM_001126 /TAXON_ID=44452 /ORGANISM="Pavlova gyrans, Strain CCMP608" /LENGTH=447 /DNA_ID=CAMNT_0053419475 /DNA_START=1 /DNA_END=1344 /DNA_ORIENTATION=+